MNIDEYYVNVFFSKDKRKKEKGKGKERDIIDPTRFNWLVFLCAAFVVRFFFLSI